MAEEQQLGGARKGVPLEDENCYPLTMDEHLTIKENLRFDKFTSLESVLLSTFITTLLSGIVFFFTFTFEKLVIIENVPTKIIDWSHVIIISIYSGVSLGSLLGVIFLLSTKKKTKKYIDRLDVKITKHLEKT